MISALQKVVSWRMHLCVNRLVQEERYVLSDIKNLVA